jgi:hypothetical protein
MEPQKRFPGWAKGFIVGIIPVVCYIGLMVFMQSSSEYPIDSSQMIDIILTMFQWAVLLGGIGALLGWAGDRGRRLTTEIERQQFNKERRNGGYAGLLLALLTVIWIILRCDQGCNESPIYFILPFFFPLFFILGRITGAFWRHRVMKIVSIVIIAFILIPIIFEFLG